MLSWMPTGGILIPGNKKKKKKKKEQALDIAALILEQCAARGQGAKADCWAILKA